MLQEQDILNQVWDYREILTKKEFTPPTTKPYSLSHIIPTYLAGIHLLIELIGGAEINSFNSPDNSSLFVDAI